MSDDFYQSIGDHPTLFGAGKEGIVFEPGHLVAHRFEVIEAIGGGGMGIVYKVKDTLMTDRDKALKVILPSLVRSEKAQERFVVEAQIAQELAHTNIVNTYDLGEHEGIRFITMEFLEGESLAEKLEREGTLSLKETIDIIQPVLQALEYAHETTVHRDIKPQNIYLCSNGKVKVLDFGLARVIGSQRFNQSSAAVGTAMYMAPEQLRGNEATPKTDLYSIGVVLYQCLVGEVPLGRFKMPSKLKPAIGEDIDNLILDLLEPDPVDRIQDAIEVRKALTLAFADNVRVAQASEPLGGRENRASDTEKEVVPKSTLGFSKGIPEYILPLTLLSAMVLFIVIAGEATGVLVFILTPGLIFWSAFKLWEAFGKRPDAKMPRTSLTTATKTKPAQPVETSERSGKQNIHSPAMPVEGRKIIVYDGKLCHFSAKSYGSFKIRYFRNGNFAVIKEGSRDFEKLSEIAGDIRVVDQAPFVPLTDTEFWGDYFAS